MRTLLLLGLIAFSAVLCFPAAAQETAGVVEGRAVGADGTPLSYALVVLVPQDPEGRRRPRLTQPDGGFRFENVRPGEYRLRLERIGFRTESSPVLRVEAGRAVVHELRSVPQPVEIAGIVADGSCFTLDRLEERPYLAALWAEAQKNAEARRAFERQYRYVYTLRQETVQTFARGTGETEQRDTIVQHIASDPDSAEAREEKRYRQRRAFGIQWLGSLTLDLPEDRELLSDGFLRDHCLEGRVQRVAGNWEFGFRPVRLRRGRIDVQGTIRVDTATFRVTALTFEYLNGDNPFMEATVRYGDFEVPGGVVRLPHAGTFGGRPPGRRWGRLKQVSGTVEYADYRDLRPARPTP
ncbi:MAG TPA: carboxypeptidase-like regulatory domain-containing protein [Longimicrobiaceae bacterium]|nr:carboxypeptidase-like regulatory domain-containing protein [Longimicrobiaceae bacterium]